jgi:hypothetical protein
MPNRPLANRRAKARLCEATAERRLTPDELGALTQRMVDAPTEAEAEELKEEIIRGIYAKKPDV